MAAEKAAAATEMVTAEAATVGPDLETEAQAVWALVVVQRMVEVTEVARGVLVMVGVRAKEVRAGVRVVGVRAVRTVGVVMEEVMGVMELAGLRAAVARVVARAAVEKVAARVAVEKAGVSSRESGK